MNSTGAAGMQQGKVAVKVEPIDGPEDLARAFDLMALTFGHQTPDTMFMAANPGWNTAQGRSAAIARLVGRWSAITKDRNGRPNTVFLKALVPKPENPDNDVIAGVAIWVQASMLDGYGDAPEPDLAKTIDLDSLYPQSRSEQRYLCQLDRSFRRRRIEVINEIASSSSPAAMVLDLCVVDPSFQRQGIATKLVEWGLAEAKNRGGLEAILEASGMGRHVYRQLGFYQEGDDIRYELDEEFRGRDGPSNVFMRTGRPGP
ncbi:hypothetical protein N7492_000274 [Penicillium capsulatum]|uniref:N-acetyltransferase domain-containing protein n=1 Tax=Penicillium capsulatum TaxID=69766 RepID=A0A9W9IQX9_9EURO|nr:hypothetical protein N7492_000274 [Penicillium capsulatum]KAJ6130660.1 hypothetical protein N7512_003440 [Penicillium capsulatum]